MFYNGVLQLKYIVKNIQLIYICLIEIKRCERIEQFKPRVRRIYFVYYNDETDNDETEI